MVAPTETDELEDQRLDGELLDQGDLAELVAPELETPDGINPEGVMRILWDDLIRGEHVKAIQAEAEMRRVIELNNSLEHRMQDGLGQLDMRVPLSVYLHWIARYGKDFWREKSNRDFFAARNPGMRIKTAPKCTIIKPEFSGAKRQPEVSGVNGGAGAALTTAPALTGARKSRGGRWARR